MLNLFKTKEQKREELLDSLVRELRLVNTPEEVIIKRLRELKVPEKYIYNNFQINLIKREVKKVLKNQDIDEMEEETSEEEMEEETSEEDDEETKPSKPVKQEKKVLKKEENRKEVTLKEILLGLDQRLMAVESTLYRLRGI